MRTAQGPFPMQTTYTWADAEGSRQAETTAGIGLTAWSRATIKQWC